MTAEPRSAFWSDPGFLLLYGPVSFLAANASEGFDFRTTAAQSSEVRTRTLYWSSRSRQPTVGCFEVYWIAGSHSVTLQTYYRSKLADTLKTDCSCKTRCCTTNLILLSISVKRAGSTAWQSPRTDTWGEMVCARTGRIWGHHRWATPTKAGPLPVGAWQGSRIWLGGD